MMGLVIYGAVGGTATTATVSYTDDVNGAGRTSADIVFGGSSANAAGQVLVLIPQAGDRNPVSVESVTLANTTCRPSPDQDAEKIGPLGPGRPWS